MSREVCGLSIADGNPMRSRWLSRRSRLRLQERMDPAGREEKEHAMKLSDLIELFTDEENAPGLSEARAHEREDTSSLADIARILRELDGQCELDREEHWLIASRRSPRQLQDS